MSLTVPRSSRPAGYLTKVPSMPADQTGAQIAKLGEALASVAGRVEQDRRQREMQVRQRELAQDMGALHGQVAAIADPDAAEAAWAEGTRAIRASYLDETAVGPAKVSAANHEPFQQYIAKLETRYAEDLGGGILAAKLAQRSANLAALGDTLADQWAGARPGLRRVFEEEFDLAVDREVAVGLLPREEATRRKAAFREDAETRELLADLDLPDGAPEPDPVRELEARLAVDPAARRLADARNFAPTSAADIEAMQADLDAFDALPEAQREEFVSARQERAGRARRAVLPRPRHLGGGDVSVERLRAAAERLAAAYRGSALSRATYLREARLIRDLMETFQ
ncbi:hypothetical protein [Marinovum algicola]|uniref:hypothetical protein n=1 Tax=Marinovum algicola TaxID=42444 RepID=UPI003B525D59